MDINVLRQNLENTGATVLECDIIDNNVSVACNVTSYSNFKQCLSICETDCGTDYPNFYDVSFYGNLFKFLAS